MILLQSPCPWQDSLVVGKSVQTGPRPDSGVFDTDQVGYFCQHAADAGAVIVFHRLIEATKTQGRNNFFLLCSASDGASYLCNLELGH